VFLANPVDEIPMPLGGEQLSHPSGCPKADLKHGCALPSCVTKNPDKPFETVST